MAYPPGTVFAGFVLQRVLGAGGMGTVYLARHPRLPRLYALKLLSPELSHDPDFRRRFEQEAELAARLDHPNLVGVNDRGIHDEQLWIQMQYVEGQDCAQALAQDGPPPVEETLRIITEVGKGLDHAHRLGLLHRDVKPGNILLAAAHDPDDPPRVLLTDFGVAKDLQTKRGMTGTGDVVATLAYAAPEQVLAQELDHRTDIYALGCVLVELLTGEVPYPGAHSYEIMGHHLNSPPPRPSDRVPGLPPGLDDVVARALAKDRNDRFGSCRELTAAARSAIRANDRAGGAVRAGTVFDPAASVEAVPRTSGPMDAGGDAPRNSAPPTSGPRTPGASSGPLSPTVRGFAGPTDGPALPARAPENRFNPSTPPPGGHGWSSGPLAPPDRPTSDRTPPAGAPFGTPAPIPSAWAVAQGRGSSGPLPLPPAPSGSVPSGPLPPAPSIAPADRRRGDLPPWAGAEPQPRRRRGNRAGRGTGTAGRAAGRGRQRLLLGVVALAAVVLLVSAGITAAVVLSGRDDDAGTAAGGAVDGRPLPVADPLPEDVAVVALIAAENLDLYLVDVASGSLTGRLTSADSADRSPALAPDRRTIVYLSDDGSAATVRVMAADGSGDRTLFAVEPDGCAEPGRPSWNPATAGELVVACSDGDTRRLLLVGVDGAVRRVLDLGDLQPLDPTFAPDGSRIVFSAGEPGESGGGSLYTVATDGASAPVQLTDSGERVDTGPVYSPDGDSILFRRRIDNPDNSSNPEIYLMRADGSNQRAVASDPAPDTGPGWSPDGTQIVFMSERPGDGAAGTNHLWVIGVDGTGLRQVLRNAAGDFGYAPSWAPR